jgi:hypothetical protein
MDSEKFSTLEKKADSGDAKSLYKLAMLYRSGASFPTFYVPKDPDKSNALLSAATELGYIPKRNFLKVPIELLSQLISYIFNGIDRATTLIEATASKLFSPLKFILLASSSLLAIYLLIKGVAALPVSIAIVIGAIIIALAIS